MPLGVRDWVFHTAESSSSLVDHVLGAFLLFAERTANIVLAMRLVDLLVHDGAETNTSASCLLADAPQRNPPWTLPLPASVRPNCASSINKFDVLIASSFCSAQVLILAEIRNSSKSTFGLIDAAVQLVRGKDLLLGFYLRTVLLVPNFTSLC